MRRKQEKLSKDINYEFQDPRLLKQALTHRSASRNHYERLEFLGDGVLNCIVASYLFKHYPRADEGVLSRYRAALVKEKTLAHIAKHVSLGDYIELGPGEMKSGGDQRDSILADSLEAIIGAVYLDGGFERCAQMIVELFDNQFKQVDTIVELKDAKTRLQEYLQSKRLPLPEYVLVKLSGEAHLRHFIVECHTVVLDQPTVGEGSSRRAAEQAAAGKAVELIDA